LQHHHLPVSYFLAPPTTNEMPFICHALKQIRNGLVSYHCNEGDGGDDSNPRVKSVEIVVAPISVILYHCDQPEHDENCGQ
jgi:peptide subunit release factor 1 (eRF1)